MYDLRDLYQEIVMDHNRRPRNFHTLQNANREADGFNPLCGDKINLYLVVENEIVSDVGFQAVGCAISKASASMMTESIKSRNISDVNKVIETFMHMITKQTEGDYDVDILGDLELLSGVSEYPARIKCATLSWHTLKSALASGMKRVTTE